MLVSDQGRNVDGEGVREMYKKYGIKNDTRLRIISARPMEWLRGKLDKSNRLSMSDVGIAPHLLAFGRQPVTSLEARIAKAETGGRTSGEGYAEELFKKEEEHNAIAKRNQEVERAKVKD